MQNADKQEFTFFGAQKSSCVSIDDAVVHYPGLQPKFMPTGHSDSEEEVWALPCDWGW